MPTARKTTSSRSKKKTTARRNLKNRNLNAILYGYVEKENLRHAKTFGKNLFGSHSAYINALIAKDRGVKPKLGNRTAH